MDFLVGNRVGRYQVHGEFISSFSSEVEWFNIQLAVFAIIRVAIYAESEFFLRFLLLWRHTA